MYQLIQTLCHQSLDKTLQVCKSLNLLHRLNLVVQNFCFCSLFQIQNAKGGYDPLYPKFFLDSNQPYKL
ncbi:hypothetical protein BpHYR1_035894 [Brachionus plicatilis]|uniref:Uncharacterized protein n=1 Tax=Brachionus plicatilis TaxID=10195 RepID=A0A3M7Q7S9_BRAPC|nr:hypothetical protein BpHYR1_035894 [Brachionus plicatilis]